MTGKLRLNILLLLFVLIFGPTVTLLSYADDSWIVDQPNLIEDPNLLKVLGQSDDENAVEEVTDSDENLAQETDKSSEEKQESSEQKFSKALSAARQKLFESYFEAKTDLKNSEWQSNELDKHLGRVVERETELQNALNKLNENIIGLEDKMDTLERNILEKKKDVVEAMRGIREKEADMKNLEKTLAQIAKELYYKSNDTDLEVFLDGKTFAEAVNNLDSLNVLEEEASLLYEKLEKVKLELSKKKDTYKSKKNKLEQMKLKLEDRKLELETLENHKLDLLEALKTKEDAYTQEMEFLNEEQDQIEEEVKYLYDHLSQLGLQEKLDRLDLQFGDKYMSFDNKFVWSVDPSYKGLSAFFDDPGYVSRFGVSHKAIDIPAPMGTPFRAAADGYVVKAKDPKNNSYNAIILMHADNLMTVYGHVSDVLVEEGSFVQKGDIIGLTGGKPGTLGAGGRTTGPHLHFEIRENGERVDPLKYLP